MKTTESIIVFDGECNLCNGVVGWLLKFVPADRFEFIAFQSKKGQEQLSRYGYPLQQLDTVILIENDNVVTHSDGFLKIVSTIPQFKLAATLLAFVPKIIRDSIYRLASRNRVKWFGQSKSCTINFSGVTSIDS